MKNTNSLNRDREKDFNFKKFIKTGQTVLDLQFKKAREEIKEDATTMNSLNRDQQNKTERWVEEFDKEFRISNDKYGRQRLCEEINLPVRIKQFISQLLSDARREERERCLMALPKKKHYYAMFHRYNQYPNGEPKDVLENWWNVGHDSALTTAEESIKKLDQISQSVNKKDKST